MTLPSRTDGNGILVLEDMAPARAGSVRYAGASHPGLLRDRNEDRLHLDAARGILAVIDGMGGEAAGEVAAETALAKLLERLERRAGTPEDRVREAIASANNEIVRLSSENPAWQGMGCVLTVALIERGIVTVGHVGDSRLYRLHAGRLDKLTHDHSPVGMREDQGEISERDAMHHPRRNEVYRAVGGQPHEARDDEFVEVLRFPLEREDAILICSDGLTDLVDATEITRVVRDHAGDERALVQRLVDAANAAGGKDNVTVAFAAGDRFAEDFVRPRPKKRLPAREEARGEFDLWGRRSTFFVLGALAGLLLYAGFAWQDRWRHPQTRVSPDPQILMVPSQHRVGPGLEFRTIGDALAASRPGDTVLVAPGRYREQVRLEEGVTLMGAVPGQAVIEPPGDATGPVAALVIEGLSGGRVQGLAIAPPAGAALDYGIVIRDASATVEDVDVRGARVAGVAIEGTGAPALLASVVHHNPGAGIVVRGRATPRILHNRITDNGDGATPLAPGIDVEHGARPRIENNVIAGNAAEGVRGAGTRALLETNVFEAFGKSNHVGATRAAARR